jgi:hypothetical protein
MRARSLMIVATLIVNAAAAFAGGQQCQGKPARSESDFVFLAGGAQVQDTRYGLIWMRCLEGQTWDGATCKADDPKAVDPGPKLTYAEAKKYAAARSTPDEAWRLPTKVELITIREPGCYNPSLNLKLFPTEPAWSSDGAYWTSTPEAEGVALVDAIGASDAWQRTDPSHANHVRLVRTVPKEKPTSSPKDKPVAAPKEKRKP